MTAVRRRALTVAIAIALSTTGAACSGSGDSPRGGAVGRRDQPASTSTSIPISTAPTPGAGSAKAVVSPAGIVVPVVSAAGNGWVVRTPCNATATLTSGTPVRSAAVVLDAGHGGAESGAVAPTGLTEAALNLAVARQAQVALEAQGVSTLLSRTGDYEVTLPTRSEIARTVNPRAFVSVHHNADPDGRHDGPGSETYFQIGSADSRRLAGLVYEEVVKALAHYQVAWVGDRDAGAKFRPGRSGDYYAVLRQSAPVVSVLAELAFVSNPPEAELLVRPEIQRVEGEALARGIVRYLRTADPGSGFTEPYPRVDPPAPPPSTRTCRDPTL